MIQNIFNYLIIFSALFLAGCNPFVVYRPDSDQLRNQGWAKYGHRDVDPEPVYCYRSLADRVCYYHPLPEDDKRLVGFYGPDPMPAQGHTPYEAAFD